jgi:hypothetical protein
MENNSGLNTKPRASPPNPEIEHRSINEMIKMNKYQVLLLVERLLKKPKPPQLEHVAIPLGLCLAFLLSLFTSDFKDFLGVKASDWHGFTFFLFWTTAGIAAIMFLVWLFQRRKNKTPEEIVNDLIQQIECDYERLSSTGQQGIGGENDTA